MEEISINDEKPDINTTRTVYDESHLTKASYRSKSLESLDNTAPNCLHKICFVFLFSEWSFPFPQLTRTNSTRTKQCPKLQIER